MRRQRPLAHASLTLVLLVTMAATGCKDHKLRPLVSDPPAPEKADAFNLTPTAVDAANNIGDAALSVPPGVLSDLSCAEARSRPANAGCSFFAVQMSSKSFWDGACFAMAVVNPTTRPAKLKLEREETTFSLSQVARVPKGSGRELSYEMFDEGAGLPPGGVIIVFLAHDRKTPAQLTAIANAFCPVPPALEENAHLGLDSTKTRFAAVGRAFHLTSDQPVVAYQFYPYGGARLGQGSASLLLPEEAWGTEHVAVHMPSWKRDPRGSRSPITLWHPLVAIVAATDGTEVTLTAADDIVGGPGVPMVLGGQTGKLTLKAGQFVEFTAANYDLAGTLVSSNQPVGLFGGSDQMPLGPGPGQASRPNVAQQQIPPQQALGSEYVAVRYRDRLEGQPETVLWRLVGAVDGTKLSYQPAPPAGAPTELGRGQVADIWTDQAFIVRSQDAQHGFYLAGTMTGLPSSGRGGPELVNVIPTAQYLSGYVFFTDPSFPETNLVIVRKSGTGKFEDVLLECSPTPLSGWQALGDFEYARVDLTRGDFQPVIPGCNLGRHTIRSAGPFTVTVWGWGTEATGGQSYQDPNFTAQSSYAYPVGAGLHRTVD
jgi:IgGFc binding protein